MPGQAGAVAFCMTRDLGDGIRRRAAEVLRVRRETGDLRCCELGIPLAQPVSTDPTLLLRVPARHHLPPCFSCGMQQLAQHRDWAGACPCISLSFQSQSLITALMKQDLLPPRSYRLRGHLSAPCCPQQACANRKANKQACGVSRQKRMG